MNDWNMFSELPEAGDFTPPPLPEKQEQKKRRIIHPKPPKKEPKKRRPKTAEGRLLFEAQESAREGKEAEIEQITREKRAYKKHREYYGEDEEARKKAARNQFKKYQKNLYRREIWLNPAYDQDVIDHIEKQENKTEYIRGLILKDMLENN